MSPVRKMENLKNFSTEKTFLVQAACDQGVPITKKMPITKKYVYSV